MVLGTMLIASCQKDAIFTQRSKPQVILDEGDARFVETDLHLYADTSYLVKTVIRRGAGQVLEVDPGTTVRMADKTAIFIEKGGRLLANGTTDMPIVFTSSALKGTAGPQFVSFSQGIGGPNALPGTHTWYGIQVEGSPGVVAATLNCVRIEYAGKDTTAALTLRNLGSENRINNVMVSYASENPAFRFTGGNVNATNLISYAAFHADLECDNGYTGMLQNVLLQRHPFFALLDLSGRLASVMISDTTTRPVISNLSVIGPDGQLGLNSEYNRTEIPVGVTGPGKVAALMVVDRAQFRIRNAVIMGFPKGGFYLDSRSSGISLVDGKSELTHTQVHSNDSARVFFLPDGIYPPYTSVDFKNYMLAPRFSNAAPLATSVFLLRNPYAYDKFPDASPADGSPLLQGADFSGADFGQSFFQKVTYIGAMGAEDWRKGWTNFIPNQTEYNK
jgi:hypothetical protein